MNRRRSLATLLSCRDLCIFATVYSHGKPAVRQARSAPRVDLVSGLSGGSRYHRVVVSRNTAGGTLGLARSRSRIRTPPPPVCRFSRIRRRSARLGRAPLRPPAVVPRGPHVLGRRLIRPPTLFPAPTLGRERVPGMVRNRLPGSRRASSMFDLAAPRSSARPGTRGRSTKSDVGSATRRRVRALLLPHEAVDGGEAYIVDRRRVGGLGGPPDHLGLSTTRRTRGFQARGTSYSGTTISRAFSAARSRRRPTPRP